MKKLFLIIVSMMIIFCVYSDKCYSKGEVLLDMVKKLTEVKIVPLSKKSIIVDAVKEANKEAAKSLEEIQNLNKKWKETKEIDEWIEGFLNNQCAVFLQKFQNKEKKQGEIIFSEIFVMDKQGNIVAETNRTSDYWQGDEDKFVRSYADGKGNVFIDEPFFDENTQKHITQVSVPIIDSELGIAIGAMTVGVNLNTLVK